MSETAKELAALTQDQPRGPLRPYQMREIEEEKSRLERVVTYPHAGDKGGARGRIKQLEKMIAEQAPKKIQGDRANRVHQLTKQLGEELGEEMLPLNHAQKVPVGALGYFQRGEGSKDFIERALLWKRAKYAVDPTNEDPDFANTDHLRPGSVPMPAFRTDDMVPGTFALTPEAKEHYPPNMPAEGTVDTPLKQARRREMTEAQKEKARATLAKARAARQAKREAARDGQ